MQPEGSRHDPGRQDDPGLPQGQTRQDKVAIRCRDCQAVMWGRDGLTVGKSCSRLALAALFIATMFPLVQGEPFESLLFLCKVCPGSRKLVEVAALRS
jgi:hypothetical protein